MTDHVEIDVEFDFHSDTPPGKDPDTHSPTLRRYHRLLWSKNLPCGRYFELVDTTPKVYLHHKSDIGEFWLASDSVIPTFTRQKKMASILAPISKIELDYFYTLGYTIAGMMLFPGRKVNGKMTINGSRGFNSQIKDRFDLTVECIRRYYSGQESPLSETLERYSSFFNLFGGFQGYIDFFLLQDIVSENYDSVVFFAPFDNFNSSPVPSNKDEYVSYMQHAIAFLEARKRRIAKYWDDNNASHSPRKTQIQNDLPFI